MKRYSLENKKSALQLANLPFLSVVKQQLSPEKKGRHVTQLQFRFIALQYLGQKSSIFSKTSRSKACSIDISSLFLVFAIFLNSGLYLTINMVVFDHSIFPNNMSPKLP